MATDKIPAQQVVKEDGPEGGTGKKKPYRSPLLTTYGHISKLTMATAGTGADGGRRAARMRVCL